MSVVPACMPTVPTLFAVESLDYVTGAGMLLARIRNNSVTYLHNNHLGSATSGTSQSGSVLWRQHYTPFGEEWNHIAANDNQAGYTGHIHDTLTGLNYMQARLQGPVSGRFLSTDPVTFLDTGDPFQFNRYIYGNNNPVNMIDPNGMDPYLGSRSVKGSGFYHMYVVYNAEYVGDLNATVLSWGQGKRPGSNETALVNHSELAQGKVTNTLANDISAWTSMTEDNLGNNVQSINASDETVESIGNATTGNADYDLFPALSRGGANSNSAAASVANRATQVDNPGAAAQALPDKVPAVYFGQSGTSPVSLPGSAERFQERVELEERN